MCGATRPKTTLDFGHITKKVIKFHHPGCCAELSHIVKSGQEMCSIGPVPYQAPDCSVAIYKRTRMRRIKKLHIKEASSGLFDGGCYLLRSTPLCGVALYRIPFLSDNNRQAANEWILETLCLFEAARA